MREKIFKYIDEHRQEMLTFWKELVSIESGTLFKEDVDQARDFLVKAFTDIGGTVTSYPYEKAGDLLVVDFSMGSTAAPIIFSGHYDTVFRHGTIEERPFVIKDDGRAYGPGVLDMKAGITMLYFIVRALQAADYRAHPIRVVLAGDEETGHQSSTAERDFSEAVKGACAAFNFETGYMDDGFVTGRKGGCRAYFTVKGVGAHAGNEPEKGRSAILEMAHKIIAIQANNDFEAGLTYNCGVVQGGTVPNAVPEEAKLVVDVRFKRLDQVERARRELEAVAATTYVEGTMTEMKFDVIMSPMETTDGVVALFRKLEETANEIGFGPIYQKYVGGGADSAYEVKMGVPTVCAVGVAGGKNHSVDEFAVVDTLFSRAKLVAATVLKI